MSDYVIQAGDSFWKIGAQTSGAKTNAQKVKTMYELAEYNNLDINQTIHPGQVLKIPDKYESIFQELQAEESKESDKTRTNMQEQEPKAEQQGLYDKFKSWLKGAYTDAKAGTYDAQTNNFQFTKNNFANLDSSITSLDHDDMVETLNTDWKNGVGEIAKGNIEESDANKNGTLDFNEFINQELTTSKEITGEEIDLNETDLETGKSMYDSYINMFKQTFSTIDADKDGKIEQDELATFYGTMDKDMDDNAFGKIALSGYSLSGNNFAEFQNRFKKIGEQDFNLDFNVTTNKYLNGLTYNAE